MFISHQLFSYQAQDAVVHVGYVDSRDRGSKMFIALIQYKDIVLLD